METEKSKIAPGRVILPAELRQPATRLAPWLLGKTLCRRIGGQVLRFELTETECYFGQEDSACHAHRGRTPRTDTLYMAGGVAYVYLCYGMHCLFNVVTGPAGHPEAVLVRGVRGIQGPGRVSARLEIGRELNRVPLLPENGLWLEDPGTGAPDFTALPRVGIDYADPADRDRPWRFLAGETPRRKK